MVTMNVFLCDDAKAYRSLVRTVLDEAEDLHVVGEACDGLDCIDKVGQADPDVILLDVNMPRLDGSAAIPGLRDKVPGAQIVMLSTSPPAEQASECLRLGARAYIQKPRDVFALPGLLRDALS
jgi:two-component system chemotaxis response regulator CheY